MRYKLIRASSPTSLTDEVNSYLAAGWKIYGSPFYAHYDDSGYTYYCQAVILENP